MAACVCAPNIRQLADKKSTLNKKLDQFPLALLLYSFHTTKRASSSAMAIPARNTICYDTYFPAMKIPYAAAKRVFLFHIKFDFNHPQKDKNRCPRCSTKIVVLSLITSEMVCKSTLMKRF